MVLITFVRGVNFFTYCLCILFSVYSFSQITVSGTVTSQNETLYGATILAKPLVKGAKFSYTTTNERGGYDLKLTPNVAYKFTVSFMGYITLKQEVVLKSTNLKQHFILKQDPNELEEITIVYKKPIVVKKDTTTYRADSFTNGKERKLREILKKLPGLEVDKEGNVSVKGKKVTTVLVENKEFFTGDSKLAVNNIPADVIEEIQVIEDYHESELLKGFDRSDKVVLNINLKEDKKQFVFGDIESGVGVEERYIFHPTLFRYSKKINYSFIGDANNVGEKSFKLKDYVNYEGGFDKDNIGGILSSPVVRLLRENEFNENRHLFSGLHIQFDTPNDNDWSVFMIALDDKTKSLVNQFQNYLQAGINEDKKTTGSQYQKMLLGKIQLKSRPNENTRIKFENKVEIVSAKNTSDTESIFADDNLSYFNSEGIDNIRLKSSLSVEKKFSKNHTSQGKLNFLFSGNKENKSWFSDKNIFSEALNIQEDDDVNLYENTSLRNYEIKSLLKHFWIINRRNHLYFSIKNELFFNDYLSNLYQATNIGIHDFLDFESQNNNREVFSSFALEYKRFIWDIFVTLKLQYLNYNRFNTQFGVSNNLSKQIILPTFNLNWYFYDRKKLLFNYSLSNRFPSYNQLNITSNLMGFNSVYIGNNNLQGNLYHSFRLSFRKSENYGWNFYPIFRYRLVKEKIQNIYTINEDIYTINSSVNLVSPERSLSTDLNLGFTNRYWKFRIRTSYNNLDYISVFNGQETDATSNSYTFHSSFKTMFIKGPNIDVSSRHTYNDNKNVLFQSISNKTKLDFAVDYEIGNWIFKGETLYNYYSNKVTETENSYNAINASIFYKKEDSLWAFELKGSNLGGNTTRIDSSLSDILFNETRTAVFPRVIMAKIIYKL